MLGQSSLNQCIASTSRNKNRCTVLPLDLYLKLGISINYDNQPAGDAHELDYIYQFGFGWEW